MPLIISYDSTRRLPGNLAATAMPSPSISFGEVLGGSLWEISSHRSLVIKKDNAASIKAVQAARGNSVWWTFSSAAGATFIASADTPGRLVKLGSAWLLYDDERQAVELYDLTGRLISASRVSGGRIDFSAEPGGRISGLANEHGQSVSFGYSAAPDGTADRLTSISRTGGGTVIIQYDDLGRVKALVWSDGTAKTFLYGDSRFEWALTGVVDERNVQVSAFAYDAEGRAVLTERAGGSGRYEVTYADGPRWIVSESQSISTGVIYRDFQWHQPSGLFITRPDGSSGPISAVMVLGVPSLSTQFQPAGAGCAAATSARTYDSNGNIASDDDFNSNRVCYAYDMSRNVETTRVEGVDTSAACASLLSAGAGLPNDGRKISTQWHPNFRLPVRVSEPNRITTYVYNGQSDPFAGGTTASCAPSSSELPDGEPIAALCKQVEQATFDSNGGQGFSAQLQYGSAARVQSWTYNASGQVLTRNGPRTDLSDVTTYTYYGTTTADYAKGDLQSMTNALGRTTQYTKYNPHGQLLESIDPNGIKTTNTYDLRQRMLSTSTAGQTTSYTYDLAGQLTRVTRSDGSYVGFEYDAAQRQTAVFDNLGNRIEYTLDNAGNRTAEAVKDPGGNLRRQVSRMFDALGRVQQLTGQE